MYDIVVNPATGSVRGMKTFHKIRPFLDREKIPYRLHCSKAGKGIGDIVRELSSGKPCDIIIIGGDGSMNEAVNGIADFDSTRLAFIPSGSGNDLGRDLKIKTAEEEIRRIVTDRAERLTDIGLCEYNGKKRLFNISSGLGFDAETCFYADRSPLKGILNRFFIGKLVYILTALKLIFRNKTFELRVKTSDGRTEEYRKCLFVVGMNHRFEGGGFMFCPEADDSDGLLDICLVDGVTPLKFLWMFPTALNGKHVKYKEISIFRAESVELSVKHPCHIHHDGESDSKTDFVRLSVFDKKLRLI